MGQGSGEEPRPADVAIVGAGPNGLVAAAHLPRAGLQVTAVEASDAVGGACRTESPRAPALRQSTGADPLAPMPRGLLRPLGLGLPRVRRDSHCFWPGGSLTGAPGHDQAMCALHDLGVVA